MKYIITENKLNDIIFKYLNSEYGNLVPDEDYRNPNHIYFVKDTEIIVDYNKKNGQVHLSYDKIWKILESLFGLEYEEIRDLTKVWVKNQYKLNVTTTNIEGY